MSAPPASLAQVYLAGFAAEHLLTGRRPRQYDIETGLGILAHTDRALVTSFDGVGASDGYGAVEYLLRTGVREKEAELRAEIDRLYEVTRESVALIWSAVKGVAEALLGCDALDREGIDFAIGRAEICAPVFAIRRAHGLLRVVDRSSNASVVDGGLVEARMSPARKKPKGMARRDLASRVADPRISILLKALRRTPTLAAVVDAYESQADEGGSKFGKNGLKTSKGKLFALFTQGTLVVKLPNERVASLMSEGLGEPFDPGHGRLMKGWLTVTSPKASWAALAKEAHAYVNGGKS